MVVVDYRAHPSDGMIAVKCEEMFYGKFKRNLCIIFTEFVM